MMTLRAIGNTGHAETAVPSLYSCIEGDNSMDIKIAAIQAFRKLSCATDVSLSDICLSVNKLILSDELRVQKI
jgi:hypothetical protein